ncbi:hypothetical protein LTR56_000307 [Elasticomyces elasticus]|nr:hypothetical protein LTR56_000307 [Elasticomyces elasticus]KAK3666997.1 hypothetical protein LTR22_002222 [Elasticomyces elasticus]KAK4933299.1 hypothetical protein LTR49_000293 [Elasticomyces elasticus]KAK5757347.1 hypothetical protein LTS12_012559 [Elasticomyces elasticus]
MPPKKASANATAASDRPRRAAAPVESKKPAAAPASKKRKAPEKAAAAPAKKRGRPSKASAATVDEDDEDEDEEDVDEEAPAPKKRGRPAKAAAAPKKAATANTKAKAAPKKAAAATSSETAAPKKRGRPAKGGATTKAAVDEDAAEAQPEEELADAADADGEEAETGELPPAQVQNSKRYWLMKAEQEDREETTHDGTVINTRFTIDDLRSKTSPELWDGVRNPLAAKNMRAMQIGDLAFFYASGGKQGRAPGITGLMEIVSAAEHDITTSDPSAYGYVDDEKKRDRWCVIGVEFRKKLSKPVSLKQLQEYKNAALENMQLFKQSRLSVSEVSYEEWSFIMELVQGYE